MLLLILLFLLIEDEKGLFFMVEWIRGQFRYSLTTEDLKAEIQVEHTRGLDPEVMRPKFSFGLNRA